jgi:predicted methyltransferase MtxX (methanogen marker protein 4)
MAKLKSLRVKDKVFIFTSYGNNLDKKPAKIIFNRFPFGNETFARIDKKNIFEGVELEKINEEDAQKRATENMVNNYIDNIMAGNIDYRRFFEECVDRFDDFEYDQSKVVTVNDFWQILPADAAMTIAAEAYTYAMRKDEFTMGE